MEGAPNVHLQALQAVVQSLSPVSTTEMEAIRPLVKVRTLPKQAYWIQAGAVCRELAFIAAGYLRVSYLHTFDEITRDINRPHTFVTALPSYIRETPSFENIQAVTDCTLLTISKASVENLYEQFPKWERFGRRVIEEMFVEAQQRLHAFITEPAEVRYAHLMATYPDILDHVPLQYVASYLGITQPSLSRIRRKAARPSSKQINS